MFAKLIVSFAYFLDSSKSYKRAEDFAYDLLENPKSKIKPYFDSLIIFLVLSTVSILIYDISHRITYHFEIIENVAVSIFIVEWIGRFWISDNSKARIIRYHEKMVELGLKPSAGNIIRTFSLQKMKYVFSPMSIIDLLAILPAYRPLRILRIFNF